MERQIINEKLLKLKSESQLSDNDDDDELQLSQILPGQQDPQQLSQYRQYLWDRVRGSSGCPSGHLKSRKSTNKSSKFAKLASDCYVLQHFIDGERTSEIHDIVSSNVLLNDSLSITRDVDTDDGHTASGCLKELDVLATLLKLQADVDDLKFQQKKSTDLFSDVKERLTKVFSFQDILISSINGIRARLPTQDVLNGLGSRKYMNGTGFHHIMPGVRLPFQCVVCKTRTNPKNRRKINSELKQLILKRLPIELKDTDVLCNKCRIKHFYKLSPVENFDNKLIDQSDNEEYQPPISKKTSFASPPSVRLNIPSTPKSHSRCFICKRPGPKLIVVPSEARFTAFVQRNVIIKSGTRCCPVHMDESQIKDEALQSVKASESAFVNRATVLELLNKLRASCNKTQK
ncbi:hypothetical protein MAR_009371 [Mya arenaria]|uniref:Uncharacterized protein n=1 Tax=Mya arenaria TaxID=6604 RepID=A0ABY7E1W3_MYAAR|nr:hypothetical protein MAR_009371 [Mya arenaria]